MPSINALQHLFSSVERGYDPRRKRGFQTVALSAELVWTEDLRALEDAAFYAVSRERRAAREFPVKETFFRLPSGSFAIGRTVNWGTDSLGREGNYLAHHLVLDREALLAAGAQPLALLDAAPLAKRQAEVDLTPRTLPPLELAVAPAPVDFDELAGRDAELLAALAATVMEDGARTALLIGAEARSRELLRGLMAALAAEERLRVTFSTHGYEAHHLRALFALVTVWSRAEAPSQRESYAIFDLETGECPPVAPANAYAGWLAGCLRARRWAEIGAFNVVLDGLRGGQPMRVPVALLAEARACAALWERAGAQLVPALVGDARALMEFLRQVPAPRALADDLLAAAAPSVLCGAETEPEEAQQGLVALRAAATGKAWRVWTQRWHDDPTLAALTPEAKPWWRRWALW